MARWLVDTNVLLRGVLPNTPEHELARKAGVILLRRGDELCFTLQGLAEFWNVCTRPATARGGFGLSVGETARRTRMIERLGTYLPDITAVRTHWQQLVITHQVQGVQVHDARLVASMLAHHVTHLITFNTTDFRRYSQITAVHPQDVLDGKV